jgi:hypothetical protein
LKPALDKHFSDFTQKSLKPRLRKHFSDFNRYSPTSLKISQQQRRILAAG